MANNTDGRAGVLWIGGAQWAGKSSVAHALAIRHGLIVYPFNYHEGRSHATRARTDPGRYPHWSGWLAALEGSPDDVWVTPTPAAMAAATLANFEDTCAMVRDDLAALPACATVLAEGWGLRPAFVASQLSSPRRAIFLVPTESFRRPQIRRLPRAARLELDGLSDPERAQHNRLERDRLLAENVVAEAERCGLRVVHVDGGVGVGGMVALVEEHFRPHLPRWFY